jgi:hypothetical protein
MLSVIMLNVIVLSVFRLNVIMLSVFMLSVVVPSVLFILYSSALLYLAHCSFLGPMK